MNRFLKGAFLAASVAVAMSSAGAFAADGAYATFDIKLEPNPQVSEVSPVVSTPITKDHVAFHIINNTGKALYFNSNEGEYIPLVSNNTVTVPYQAGDSYKVVDAEGNTVATWNLNGNGAAKTTTVASASQDQFAQWGNTLQQVISNQKVSYQEPPAKPEPQYYQSKGGASSQTASKTVIRGFW